MIKKIKQVFKNKPFLSTAIQLSFGLAVLLPVMAKLIQAGIITAF